MSETPYNDIWCAMQELGAALEAVGDAAQDGPLLALRRALEEADGWVDQRAQEEEEAA